MLDGAREVTASAGQGIEEDAERTPLVAVHIVEEELCIVGAPLYLGAHLGVEAAGFGDDFLLTRFEIDEHDVAGVAGDGHTIFEAESCEGDIATRRADG